MATPMQTEDLPEIGKVRQAEPGWDFLILGWELTPEGKGGLLTLSGYYYVERLDTHERFWVEGGDMRRHSTEKPKAETP